MTVADALAMSKTPVTAISTSSPCKALLVAMPNSLIIAMGLLPPDNLDLGIELYDSSENFNRVENTPIRTFEAGKILDNIADRWQ